MNWLNAPLLIDSSVVILLTITIAYCWRLNRKILELQKGKKELATLFKYFEDAIERAESTVSELKQESQKASVHLEQKIKISKSLLDDFSLMFTKCSKMMHQLEELMSKSALFEKAATSRLHQSQSKAPEKPTQAMAPQRQQNDVMQMLAKERAAAVQRTQASATASEGATKEAAIEDLLRRISEVQKKQSISTE